MAVKMSNTEDGHLRISLSAEDRAERHPLSLKKHRSDGRVTQQAMENRARRRGLIDMMNRYADAVL